MAPTEPGGRDDFMVIHLGPVSETRCWEKVAAVTDSVSKRSAHRKCWVLFFSGLKNCTHHFLDGSLLSGKMHLRGKMTWDNYSHLQYSCSVFDFWCWLLMTLLRITLYWFKWQVWVLRVLTSSLVNITEIKGLFQTRSLLEDWNYPHKLTNQNQIVNDFLSSVWYMWITIAQLDWG